MERVGSGERADLWAESVLSWGDLSLPARMLVGVGDVTTPVWPRCLCSLGTVAGVGLAARGALGRLAAHAWAQLLGGKGGPDGGQILFPWKSPQASDCCTAWQGIAMYVGPTKKQNFWWLHKKQMVFYAQLQLLEYSGSCGQRAPELLGRLFREHIWRQG